MQPGESPQRPPEGRPPLPRHRSVDGISPDPKHRPPIAREGQRPVFTRRPIMNQSPARPQPVPQQSEPPAPHSTLPPPNQPEPTVVASPNQPPAVTEPIQPLQFTPPPIKKSRHLLRYAAIIILILVMAGGLLAAFQVRAARNNPDTAFHDALLASLSLTKLQTQTTAGNSHTEAKYDFSAITNPIVSTAATIQLNGLNFGVDGYGSAKNTYISYTKLPANVNSALATTVKNGWIQIRSNSAIPKDVNPALANLADPRYQAFGPIVIGNFADKTRQQLVRFMQQHHVYKYDINNISKTSLGGEKVLAYPVDIDTSYLKIVNQSAASSEGLSPEDIQAAIDALGELKGAKTTIYVSTSDHTFARLDATRGDQTVTKTYSHYNDVTLPDEPQTKLLWQTFAPFQAQLEAQAKQP